RLHGGAPSPAAARLRRLSPVLHFRLRRRAGACRTVDQRPLSRHLTPAGAAHEGPWPCSASRRARGGGPGRGSPGALGGRRGAGGRGGGGGGGGAGGGGAAPPPPSPSPPPAPPPRLTRLAAAPDGGRLALGARASIWLRAMPSRCQIVRIDNRGPVSDD